MSYKPLPPNFFTCPPLTTEEKERFKEIGYAAAHELAEKIELRGGPIQWRLDSDEKEVKIYKGFDSLQPRGTAASSAFMATMDVMGTMDEVVDLFRSQTTEQAKEYVRRFGNLMLDAVNLYSIVPFTAENPKEMIGISWRAFKLKGDKVVMKRDAVVIDTHTTINYKGKPAWIRCIKSVEIPCCPDMQELLGFVRMTHHITGHMFTESDRPGYLHIDYILQSDLKGTVGDYTSWIVDNSVKTRLRSIAFIDRFLRENRLSKTPFLTPDKCVPTGSASRCFRCKYSFNPLSKKNNCLKCGQVCCRRCIQLWDVKNRGFDAQALVCNMCALGTLEETKDPSLSDSKEEASTGSENDSYVREQPVEANVAEGLDESQLSLSKFELIIDPKAWASPSSP